MRNPYKKSLFWDVDSRKLSKETDWFFIIERILEFGDIDDFFWMQEAFPAAKIRDTIQTSRVLSARTRAYCKTSGYAS